MYLILMSLVVMNLVLGLAVSDINELEKVSKVKYLVVSDTIKTLLFQYLNMLLDHLLSFKVYISMVTG